ncbi:hypothetical protein [Marinomonas rhizomae]|uniref:Uncharacterized protein n=1 Tax=Marinomonas rhizomae TaxID=491948 RepID=A0A366IZK6_9GAMM|nr:hypothetical protein [Marinomonas rhizomae]RBP79560.1 hypothetical protein DFP80_11316 [Marinomonas rhizomae]
MKGEALLGAELGNCLLNDEEMRLGMNTWKTWRTFSLNGLNSDHFLWS